MIAYKVLEPNGSSRFSGFRWPLPNGGPGAWIEAAVDPCRSGIHAVRTRDLPYWLGPEIYELELDGMITEVGFKIVAPRGRLLRRVDGWDDEAKRAFSTMCIERARELVESSSATLDSWLNPTVESGPSLLGYVAARIAEEIGGPEDGRAERSRQARWLADRLQLRI